VNHKYPRCLPKLQYPRVHSHLHERVLLLNVLYEEVPYIDRDRRIEVEHLAASDQPGMALWREQLYTFMCRNAANAADFFCLPPARVFEIGTAIEM